jgi:hypothetical protein
MIRTAFWVSFAFAICLSPGRAAQITATWSGTANWTSTANWSLSPSTPAGFAYPNNDVPDAGDTYVANISTGSPTLNSGAVAIDALNLSNGTLTINAPCSLSLVSTTTNSSWNSGKFAGSGSLNIGTGVTMTLSPTNWNFLATTVNNNGTANANTSSTWAIVGDPGHTWNNNAGSVFDLQSDTSLSVPFNNKSGATFKKSGGTHTSNIISAFNNSGGVVNNTASGTLSFSGGGIYGGTTTITNAAASVQFSSIGATFQDSVTNEINVFGAGAFNLWSGTYSVAAGNTLTVGDALGDTPGRLTLDYQATLQGPGNIQINKFSAFNWNGGISGKRGNNSGGTTTIASGANFNLTGSCFLGETVNNYGSAKITNVGNLFRSVGAAWNNNAGAVFDLQDGSHLRNNGGAGAFTNNSGATFKMSSGPESAIYWTFNNSGTVLATGGALWFGGGGTYGGSTNITSAAASVWIVEKDVTFQDSATHTIDVFGAGIFNLVSGTHTVAAGNTLATGDSLGNTPGNLTLLFATLQGPGNLLVNPLSTFNWSGSGTLGDNTGGATTIASGATLNVTGTGSRFLGETVNNNSTATFTGAGVLYGNAGAAWSNNPGSVFDLQADASLSDNGGTGTFTNSSGATFKKSGGTGTSTIAWPFNNSGTVRVESGILSFTSTLTNAGTLSVALGSTLSAAGAINSTDAILGNGTITGGSGAITINLNSGSISPGESAGELTVSGDLNANSDATFSFEIGGTGQANSALGTSGIGAAHYDFLNVTGTLILGPTNPTLDVALVDDFIPSAGDKFWIIDSAGALGPSDIFAGLPDGTTVLTSDGLGSFIVHYNQDASRANPGAVLLDSFTLVAPEPSTSILCCLAAACGSFCRRRCVHRRRHQHLDQLQAKERSRRDGPAAASVRVLLVL